MACDVSVPMQYRRLIAVGSKQLTAISQLTQSLWSSETGLAFALHHFDRLYRFSRVGGCGLLARANSCDVTCIPVLRCLWLHSGRMQYVQRGWIT